RDAVTTADPALQCGWGGLRLSSPGADACPIRLHPDHRFRGHAPMCPQPRVAIACQGGGSHAAFAAGVLVHLLGDRQRERFRLAALSGTSGGAMCAALAWRGLVASGPEEATRRLVRFWRDLEV